MIPHILYSSNICEILLYNRQLVVIHCSDCSLLGRKSLWNKTINNKQSGRKPNLVAKIWPPKFGNHFCMVTKISSQCQFLVSTLGSYRACCGFSCQMATNNGSPHLQIRHNLSGLYLANWKWFCPIVIAFNTLCAVEFYIQWCVALHQTHLGSYFEKIFSPCLGN